MNSTPTLATPAARPQRRPRRRPFSSHLAPPAPRAWAETAQRNDLLLRHPALVSIITDALDVRYALTDRYRAAEARDLLWIVWIGRHDSATGLRHAVREMFPPPVIEHRPGVTITHGNADTWLAEKLVLDALLGRGLWAPITGGQISHQRRRQRLAAGRAACEPEPAGVRR